MQVFSSVLDVLSYCGILSADYWSLLMFTLAQMLTVARFQL